MSREPSANSKVWHVEVDGRRTGPLPSAQVHQLIASNKVNAQSMVWTAGQATWLPLADTEFGTAFHNTPPPLASERVPQGLIWVLAFAPLIGAFLEGLVSGIARVPTTSLWWITLFLNWGLSVADERRLNGAGYQTKGIGAALVVPVYMWQRAAALRQRPWYLVVWTGLFLATSFG